MREILACLLIVLQAISTVAVVPHLSTTGYVSTKYNLTEFLSELMQETRPDSPLAHPLSASLLQVSQPTSAWPMFQHDLTHTGRSIYVGSPLAQLRWKSSSGGTIGHYEPGFRNSKSPAIGSDGTIYYASDDGHLYAYSPDGFQKWRVGVGITEGLDSTPAIGADGTIYLGGYDVFAAITPNGGLKWQYNPPPRFQLGSVSSSPAIGSDGTIYYADTFGILYALKDNGLSGSQKWNYTTGCCGNFESSPAIASDGTIYIGGYGRLNAVNADGTRKWVYNFASQGIVYSSPTIGPDGTIYVSSDSHLYAISRGGTQIWNYTTGGSSSTTALGSDDTIYSESYDGYLYALNPDGTLKWKPLNTCRVEIYCGYSNNFSSLAIGGDETLYVGSEDHHLYAINPTGSIRWNYTTGGVVSSSPTIGSDGTIFVGSQDSNLYAIYGKVTHIGPKANFAFTPTNPTVNRTVLFDGSTSQHGDGPIVSYDWSFGDGSSPVSGLTVSHSYATNRTYQVILTVTDNYTLTSTANRSISVSPFRAHLTTTSDPPGCNVSAGGDYYGGGYATLNASKYCNDKVFSQWIIDNTSAGTTNGKLVSTYSLLMNQDHIATAVYLSQTDWTDFTNKMEKILNSYVNLDNLYGYIDAARGGLTSEQQDLVVDADTAQTVKGLSYVGFVLSFVVTLAPIYAIEQNDTMPQDQKEQALIHILGEQLSTLLCTAAVAAMTGGIAAFIGKTACGYLAAPLYDMAEPYLAGFGQWVSDQISSIFDTVWKNFQTTYHMLQSLYRNVITFIIGSETTVYIIDSSGRRLGGISSTGQVLHDIPNSAYTGIGTYPQEFIIANPLAGNYKIRVTNLQDGPVHFQSTAISNWTKTSSTEYVQTLSKGDFEYTFNPQTMSFVAPPGPWWSSPLVIAIGIVAAGAMISIALWRLPNRLRKALTMNQRSNTSGATI